jgi:hypothetical protein
MTMQVNNPKPLPPSYDDFKVLLDDCHNFRTPVIVLVYHATISYIDLPPVLKKYFVYGIN